MILKGDCIEVMKAIKPNSVDAIVCDPPYGLEFMGKEWDKLKIRHDGWQGCITAEARGKNDMYTKKGFKAIPEFRSLKPEAMLAIAAHNTGRKCVGIEKEDEYLTIAKRRIDYWENQPRQFALGDKNASI